MSEKLRKLSSRTLAWPTDWTELFGVTQPLIVEIGFGRGHFLLHLARQNPNANVIGIEVANRCLLAMENTIRHERLRNLRVIHSTAQTALYHLFEPGTISQLHVNFPDPWFKPRHGHRRLMQRSTLDAMVNRLAPGGTFYLATDIHAYTEMSAELLAETPGLDNVLDAPWVTEMPGRFVTKYEAAAQREGRVCYYFAYRRNESPPPTLPTVEEWDMPHIVFQSPLTLDEVHARFSPAKQEIGETHIALMEAYRGRYELLFEVYIKEPTIDQHIAFALIPRPNADEFTLQLSTLGHPRTTPGVHLAVGILGDWIAGLHPETKVLKRKLRE